MSDVKDRMATLIRNRGPEVATMFEKLSTCTHAARRIEGMSDHEVATLLDVVLDETSMLSVEFEILDAARGRLRRANGGAYRECSWCEKPAVVARPDNQWACREHEAHR